MARMSIDDSFARDTRLDDLAEFCGWTRRETAGCLQLDIWPLCYDRVTPNIRARDLDIAANRSAVSPVKHPGGFSAALVESGLARPATKRDTHYLWVKNDGTEVALPWRDPEWKDRVYVCGAADRIAYLLKKEESGRVGGQKSAESRIKRSKHRSSSASTTASSSASSTGSPSANPSATPTASSPPSAPDTALSGIEAPDENTHVRQRDLPVAGDRLQDFRDKVDTNASAARLDRQRKRPPVTPDQRRTAEVVLAKLSEHNGIRYTVSDRHAALIATQLRRGVTELELRAVVAYCAVELGWKHDERMRQFLRPETLFGPETIAKYLDPARTTYAEMLEKHRQFEAQPQPLLISDGAGT